MANKRYIDFTAQIYDSNKVFLQSDPTTGELSKCNLPQAPFVQMALGKLTQSGTSAPNLSFFYNTIGNLTTNSQGGNITRILKTGNFDPAKTFFQFSTCWAQSVPAIIYAEIVNGTTIQLTCLDYAGNGSWDIVNCYFQIGILP